MIDIADMVPMGKNFFYACANFCIFFYSPEKQNKDQKKLFRACENVLKNIFRIFKYIFLIEF